MIKLLLFRLKLVLSNKLNIFVMLLSFALLLLLINSLSFGAKERSNIPIGILDLDQSVTSKDLVQQVKKVPAFYVYEETEKVLNQLLLNEEVSGIFIIKSGFEDSIKSGITTEVVVMKYLEGNPSAKVLSDIFAGQMLYPISLAKGLKEYEALKKQSMRNDSKKNVNNDTQYNWLTGQEYVDCINELSKASDFDFAFDINMVNVMSKNSSISQLDNSVIYYQVIVGILGMIISFVAMFISAGVVEEKEQGLDKKVKITLIKPIYLELSYILALVTILCVFSFGITFILGNFIANFSLQKRIVMFIFLFLYSIVMGMWFIILGKISKRVSSYQLLGTLSILFFGFLSFLSMLEGLLHSRILSITKIIPNRWLMVGVTDMVFNDTIDSFPVTAFWRLLIIGVVLVIANGFMRKIQNLSWRHCHE